EIDLDTGKRGNRNDHVTRLLCRLTGAEDAVVVNNNAAAVFLILNTLAFGKEAVISRGELVEIGGSFRMPDIMEKSGAIMKEIGTTNKTKISDYEDAITPHTGAIVIAHTSNYRVMGFTASPALEKIVHVAHDHSLPVYHDLGGGIIVDLEKYGLPYEPLVQESLATGVDVVSFSGDKVLGGPQCGIIMGKAEYIRKIAKNPIMRAVRCGKLTYAALEATLKLYLHQESLLQNHEVLKLLTLSPGKIKKRCDKLVDRLPVDLKNRLNINVEKCTGQAGSGTLPLEKLPSYAVTIGAENIDRIYKKLLENTPPVIGYVSKEKLYLDFRTIDDSELDVVAGAILALLVI
ncbi:L-seryl-tRNA(Sec) selenium transferase, partial [candidate division KSB1 bacterium]|nr:L-seryl-tRNA(Sec) selenium transferase [candidate division KSB1 bacterium]